MPVTNRNIYRDNNLGEVTYSRENFCRIYSIFIGRIIHSTLVRRIIDKESRNLCGVRDCEDLMKVEVVINPIYRLSRWRKSVWLSLETAKLKNLTGKVKAARTGMKPQWSQDKNLIF